MKTIFVLCAYKHNRIGENGMGSRVIGWFPSMEEAVDSLHRNAAVIAEEMDGAVYYKHALIEEVPAGPYSLGMTDTDNVKFFDWEGNNYKEVERPKAFRGTIGFTMG